MKKANNSILKSVVMTIFLFMGIMMVHAVNITYSLTTHVDGRTITGTANVNSGASLENSMPRNLWRANTTYKYYSDVELTQEITVAPATDATVYVDYVFESPFFVSSDGVEYYYYFNAYISGTKFFLCDDLGSVKSNSSYRNHALWALYGDGYSINLKAKQTGKWLTYSANAPVMADSPMTTGWQLYKSSYTNNGKVYETVVLGTTNNDNQILHFNNNATPPSSSGIPSSQHAMGRFVLENITNTGWFNIGWDNHHNLHNTSSNYSTLLLSNSSFFFTAGTYQNIYSTVWRIMQADGTWYPDIVVQKSTSATQIGMPTGQNKYTEKNNCTYDRYYKDADFTDKYQDNYMIPVQGNTVIYVKESYKNGEPYVTDHWVTLALSYNVNDLTAEFGTASDGVSPAVRVLEYYDVSSNTSGVNYELKFRQVNSIEAHKPYLFKADEVLEGKNLNLQKSDPDQYPLQESYVEDKAIRLRSSEYPASLVSMIGTYLGKVLTVQSEHPDLLYFYFGYDKRYDKNSSDYVGDEAAEGKLPYNFYRVTQKSVNISKHHCYFQIENAPAGAKFIMMDTTGEIGEQISSIDGVPVERFFNNGRIYNLNGQMVGNDLESLPRGIYIVNGKKVIK